MTKRKRTNKNLQNTTQKTKARPTRIPLKSGGELKCSGRVYNSCSSSCTLRVAVYQIFIYLGVASEYIDIANPSFLLGKLMGTGVSQFCDTNQTHNWPRGTTHVWSLPRTLRVNHNLSATPNKKRVFWQWKSVACCKAKYSDPIHKLASFP